jgi:hypothetical protein
MLKKIIISMLLLVFGVDAYSQNILSADSRPDTVSYEYALKTSAVMASCGTPAVSTGYPVFLNFWAGWMVNIINTNACPIVINGFDARFQGTSGYRIYTKTGTFVGFQTTAGAWTLVGTLASLTGTSTTAPTAIPIAVNAVIPAGGTRAFYLTRSDNLVANRHLYVAGVGTAGTTVYASDANLSITEASYIDPYFAALQVGSRRPSFDVCYTINCLLPIELLSFSGSNSSDGNVLKWETATEQNNDYFIIEKSIDGLSWSEVTSIDGAGNSTTRHEYQYTDNYQLNNITYYRLTQVDYNGQRETFNIISVEIKPDKRIVKSVKCYDLLGRNSDCNQPGIHIEITEYTNSETRVKKIQK